jgi:hypothetical protein
MLVELPSDDKLAAVTARFDFLRSAYRVLSEMRSKATVVAGLIGESELLLGSVSAVERSTLGEDEDTAGCNLSRSLDEIIKKVVSDLTCRLQASTSIVMAAKEIFTQSRLVLFYKLHSF